MLQNVLVKISSPSINLSFKNKCQERNLLAFVALKQFHYFPLIGTETKKDTHFWGIFDLSNFTNSS
jgi:hypothetical protein